MKTSYEADVVAWANEQASLIRAGRFDQLDLTHIAEEIDAPGPASVLGYRGVSPDGSEAQLTPH